MYAEANPTTKPPTMEMGAFKASSTTELFCESSIWEKATLNETPKPQIEIISSRDAAASTIVGMPFSTPAQQHIHTYIT
jgi:hypothetical protein